MTLIFLHCMETIVQFQKYNNESIYEKICKDLEYANP